MILLAVIGKNKKTSLSVMNKEVLKAK